MAKKKSKPEPVAKPLSQRQIKMIAKTPQLMALVNACDLALRAGAHFGKYGTITNFNERPMVVRRWQEVYFDALDGVGIKYDRKKYYANNDSKRRTRSHL